MLDAIMKIFGKAEKNPRETARDRLKVVLIHDRANIAPEIMDSMKDEIIQVISKYVVIDKREMEISLANDADSVALVANIPISSMRHARRR